MRENKLLPRTSFINFNPDIIDNNFLLIDLFNKSIGGGVKIIKTKKEPLKEYGISNKIYDELQIAYTEGEKDRFEILGTRKDGPWDTFFIDCTGTIEPVFSRENGDKVSYNEDNWNI